jgi:hypothetical protein
MSLWTSVDAAAGSVALPSQHGEQRQGSDKMLTHLNHRRAQGHTQDPHKPKKDHIKRARSTRNPKKVKKAKDEGAGQNGPTATVASDDGMMSATPTSGLPCSDEAMIQHVSDALRGAAQEANCCGIFLDLFSGGRAPVIEALKRQGKICVPLDTLHSYATCALKVC